jgi:hypothetical protein
MSKGTHFIKEVSVQQTSDFSQFILHKKLKTEAKKYNKINE